MINKSSIMPQNSFKYIIHHVHSDAYLLTIRTFLSDSENYQRFPDNSLGIIEFTITLSPNDVPDFSLSLSFST